MPISPSDATEVAILERLRSSRRYDVGTYGYFVWPYKGMEPLAPAELEWLVERMARLVPAEADTLLSFMTDGDLLAVPLAQRLRLPLLVCRDFHYHFPNPIRIPQKTGYFSRELFVSRPSRSLSICIVDAIVATGATIVAASEAMKCAGSSVVGAVAAVEKKAFKGTDNIVARLGFGPKVLYRIRWDGAREMEIERG